MRSCTSIIEVILSYLSSDSIFLLAGEKEEVTTDNRTCTYLLVVYTKSYSTLLYSTLLFLKARKRRYICR